MPTSVRTNLFQDPYAQVDSAASGAVVSWQRGDLDSLGRHIKLNKVTSATGTAALGSIMGSLAASTEYTLSFEVRRDRQSGSTQTGTIYYRPSSPGSSTGQVSITGLFNIPTDADWTRVDYVFTTTATAPTASDALVFEMGSGIAVASTYRLRGVTLTQGSNVGQRLFSGASTDSSALDYVWTGTANASTSTETLTYQNVTLTPASGIAPTGYGLVQLTVGSTLALGVEQYEIQVPDIGLASAIDVALIGNSEAAASVTVEIEVEILQRISGGDVDGVTFTYWEKRRKDFGQYGEHQAEELKPFWYQSDSRGVHVVRLADGTFTTTDVIDEVLENTSGVRIYYGGKKNPVTEVEAGELDDAGYGDYLTQRVEDAFNQGNYNEGDYGA